MTLVGQHIGRYRILEELGSGGMSVVYKGFDTVLDREVAVKVLHPHLASREESRQRLAREAKAVARLHHPNILEVFDFSATDAKDAYLVTEYVRGRTLKDYVDELGPLDPPELAAMVIHEIAAALAHAHEAGVIHRDIKPENVMVREDGVLKLMDFGIAKLLDMEERMTITGALVGSPAHMAPEIIEGQEAGAEADVFSLGTILYALITGRLPFTATNTTATLKRILDGTYEDPRQRVPTLSDELAALCAMCLARDPARRFATAGKLRDALGDYLSGLGFPRVGEELTSFFIDPQAYRKLMRQRLISALLERSERLLAEKRTPKALAGLNQVLALDATNARALALIEGLDKARRSKQQRVWALRLGAGLLGAALLGAVGVALWDSPDSRQETPATPSKPSGMSKHGTAEVKPPRETPLPSHVGSTHQGPAVERPTPTKRPSSRPEHPRAEPLHPEPPQLTPEGVSILVRPYGFIRVGAGERSPQPLAQHNVALTPGVHTVTISCDYCEDVQETIEVRAGQENVFRLRAQLKPSQVSFAYEPADSMVRVGSEVRTARESLERPFDIQSPRGPASFQHRVEYEVSHNGFLSEKRVANVEPGKSIVLRGALVAE
jgi:serine/threonine-protein kinase